MSRPLSDRAPSLQTLTRIMTLLAVVGVAFALYQSRDDISNLDRPSAGSLSAAVLVSILVSVSGAHAWSSLFDAENGTPIRHALYVSQLSKYLPLGGLFQAAGQVGLSNASSDERQHALIKFPISMILAVGAALTSSVYALFFGDGRWWVGLFALTAPLFVWRRFITAVLGLVSRVVRRELSPEGTPSQFVLFRTFCWSVVTIHCLGIVLWILIRTLGAEPSLGLCIAAFGLAWAAGTAVVPLPSGLGVREAVLIAIIGGVAGQTVLTAALMQRIVLLVAEVLTAVASVAQRRFATK